MPVVLLLRTIILSSTVNVSVLKVVVAPLTVKSPFTTKLLNWTFDVVSTAWPIAICPVLLL